MTSRQAIYTFINHAPDAINKSARRVVDDPIVQAAWGSSHNHQAWPGGYLDHVNEMLRIGWTMYHHLKLLRPMPFDLLAAELAVFLHDMDKPWKEEGMTKSDRRVLRREKILEFGFMDLSPQIWNAIEYAEGEVDDYSPKERKMGRLAAFVHACDVLSARMWWDMPGGS
jgi:hypothetical protein